MYGLFMLKITEIRSPPSGDPFVSWTVLFGEVLLLERSILKKRKIELENPSHGKIYRIIVLFAYPGEYRTPFSSYQTSIQKAA